MFGDNRLDSCIRSDVTVSISRYLSVLVGNCIVQCTGDGHCMLLFVCLFVCLFGFSMQCLFVCWWCAYLSVCLFVFVGVLVCLSVCLFVFVDVFVIGVFICLSVCLYFVGVSVCLSVC